MKMNPREAFCGLWLLSFLVNMIMGHEFAALGSAILFHAYYSRGDRDGS